MSTGLALLALSRVEFTLTGPHMVVFAVSATVALACVLFHYEVMNLFSRKLPELRLPRRGRIVALMLVLLSAHVVEVWIFGVTYWYLSAWPELGTLSGELMEGALDYVYFSVATFTTVGFGDIAPLGPLRILSGTEALVGLSLITWSASLSFLELQRDWAEYRRPNDV